ncbi:unnamed protein product [Protopolystoma xenopodis]|uniref:Uncharacterized protein n=1 Tax=Protopolystoma xenopodis TaxID=117903 RepID=A0A448XGU1_9PLAT|nr:unnamed protein product [Protopolystoma xenopodis]
MFYATASPLSPVDLEPFYATVRPSLLSSTMPASFAFPPMPSVTATSATTIASLTTSPPVGSTATASIASAAAPFSGFRHPSSQTIRDQFFVATCSGIGAAGSFLGPASSYYFSTTVSEPSKTTGPTNIGMMHHSEAATTLTSSSSVSGSPVVLDTPDHTCVTGLADELSGLSLVGLGGTGSGFGSGCGSGSASGECSLVPGGSIAAGTSGLEINATGLLQRLDSASSLLEMTSGEAWK